MNESVSRHERYENMTLRALRVLTLRALRLRCIIRRRLSQIRLIKTIIILLYCHAWKEFHHSPLSLIAGCSAKQILADFILANKSYQFNQCFMDGTSVINSGLVAIVAISLRALRETLQALHKRVSRHERHENMTLGALRVLTLRSLRLRCGRCVKPCERCVKHFKACSRPYEYHPLKNWSWN